MFVNSRRMVHGGVYVSQNVFAFSLCSSFLSLSLYRSKFVGQAAHAAGGALSVCLVAEIMPSRRQGSSWSTTGAGKPLVWLVAFKCISYRVSQKAFGRVARGRQDTGTRNLSKVAAS